MSYKIQDGTVANQHYGLTLAKLLGFPADVIEVASEVSKSLTERIEAQKRRSPAQVQARRTKTLLLLKETLQQVRTGTLEGEALKGLLSRLQEQFVARMTEEEAMDDDTGEKVEGEDEDEEMNEVAALRCTEMVNPS